MQAKVQELLAIDKVTVKKANKNHLKVCLLALFLSLIFANKLFPLAATNMNITKKCVVHDIFN